MYQVIVTLSIGPLVYAECSNLTEAYLIASTAPYTTYILYDGLVIAD